MLKSPSELKYQTPLDIPKGTSGKVKIVHNIHPAEEPFTIVSMRDAILTGKSPFKVRFDMPVMITALHENGSVWMTDLPIEQEDAHEALVQCKGRVLVGGLGLGYFAKKLQEKKDVSHVDVVEISSDVIKLVWKYLKLDKRFNIINMDIHKWLEENGKPKLRYDWVYLDIWRADGEAEFIETVLPLKRKVKRFLTLRQGHTISWKEQTMLGQFRMGLHNRVHLKTAFRSMVDMPQKQFAKTKTDKWLKINFKFWDTVRKNHLRPSQAKKLIEPYIKWIADGMIGKFNS